MAAQNLCKACGQPIYGHYIHALGAVWHPEHFICAACHRPIQSGSYNVKDNLPYHPACYIQQFAPRCAYCGKPLAGDYVVTNGASYHPDCYREHVVPRCAYCNQPLTGGYLVDAWGTKFCSRHKQEYPACVYCGRRIPPAQQQKGETPVCPICRSTAIDTIAQAQPLFARVKQWVGSQGLAFHNLPLHLELTNSTKIAHYLGDGDLHALGVTLSTMHTLNGRELRTEVNGIAILRGLPATLFQGVVVHELGHVWLVVHGIKDLPPWAEEGFCEMLAHRYFMQLNTPESLYYARNIEQNTSPVYGEGFRRVQALVDRLGFAQVLEAMRATKHLSF
jgi:hypothetical protein